MEAKLQEPSSWLDKPLTAFLPKLNMETVLVVLILIAAVVTRFYQVDARVMSHDEVNHVVPSYNLFRGQGYAYDPVTHGPLQFHLLALSYFLMGDSDFSARVPAVLFSIATVAMALFGFRRYLGRSGAIIAGVLMLISPYMLFYGRYTRNEAFGGLWTVLMLFGALRYLEKGDRSTLFFLTVVMAFHATDKATSFIYNAEFMLFMGFVFLDSALRLPWPRQGSRNQFLYFMLAAVLLLVAALGIAVVNAKPTGDVAAVPASLSVASLTELLLVAGAAVGVVYAVILLVRNMGWATIRKQRSFDLILLAGTLTLPLLSAFPMRMLGMDPLDYSSIGMTRTLIFVVILSILAVALGLWWKPKVWLICAAIFFSIFTVFFTTFFTNGKGFFMGLVAALGYWLSQQGVQRGSQPLYYYALIQIPIYEYLPAIGALSALVVGLRHNLFSHIPGFAPASQPDAIESEQVETVEKESPVSSEKYEASTEGDGTDAAQGEEPVGELHLPGWLKATLATETAGEAGVEEDKRPRRIPVLALLLFWSVTSLVAYSLAGEKMPWLTVHITSAMILAAGWGFGYLVDTTPWKELLKRRGLLAVLLLPVFVAASAGFILSLVGKPAPFSGSTIEQLNATSNFLMGLVGTAASAVGLYYLLSTWKGKDIARLVLLAVFAFMGILTARTAFTAAYINYDLGSEFLVYAHAARGPKDVLLQVEEISKRTTRGKDIVVAYDNENLYPYWWYFRDYPNKKYFADKPARDVRDAPVIIVGDPNYSKIEPLVKDSYEMFEYMRLVWPMQDYFDLTPDRIWAAISDPAMRQALVNIWLNRDYTQYAQLTGSKSLTPETWVPGARMRMYVRKDVAAMMWNYGAAPAVAQGVTTDPYEKGMVKMAYDRVIGTSGAAAGQFNAPRGLAVAPDGSIYVADSRNQRIQHLTADGKVLQVWGTFADVMKGQAPGGTFNEPWGIAVGKDGSVFVSDTWNHRVQKFTADGKFIKMWGYFGQAEKPEAFWGPRGLAVDAQGRVFVVDTGNKRIVAFTADGDPVTSFGTAGFDPGQFDEQVGIAFDKEGKIYITDTWNQRVQVFQPDANGTSFIPLKNWEVNGWFGQSLDNKPFISVDADGNVFVTDPDGGRVLEFNSEGVFERGWSELIGDVVNLVMPAGVAADPQGGVWVSDASSNRLLHFNLALMPMLPNVQPLAPGQQQIGPQVSPTTSENLK
jgi:predicted membrane-bound mannosyltransferase/DNA-binding beta-propeller fold protein YncE